VAVKGILVFGKAVSFAGHCWNEGLDRFGRSQWVSSHGDNEPMTADVRRPPRRGTFVTRAPQSARTPRTHRSKVCCIWLMEDASFARSFDLYTLILAMHRGASLDGGAIEPASRLGKSGQPERTSTGVDSNERESAARRSSPLEREAWWERKGRRSRSPSLREQRAEEKQKANWSSCSHVV